MSGMTEVTESDRAKIAAQEEAASVEADRREAERAESDRAYAAKEQAVQIAEKAEAARVDAANVEAERVKASAPKAADPPLAPGTTVPWYVTSDPDHPVNAGQPPQGPTVPAHVHDEMTIDLHVARERVTALESENAELRSQLAGHGTEFRMPVEPMRDPAAPVVPDYVISAEQTAKSPTASFEEKERALKVLRDYEALHPVDQTPPAIGARRSTDGKQEIYTAQGWLPAYVPQPVSDVHPSTIPDNLVPTE